MPAAAALCRRGGLALAMLVVLAAAPEPLAQGWSITEQDIFRNSPVGSRVVPYDLFVRLEAEDGRQFAAPERMTLYGYVVTGPNPTNPDGLPAGFARERDRQGRLWLGMSCAACHTGAIAYRGRTLLVDGGAGLADTQRFDRDLTQALEATSEDAAKLDRLAGRLGVDQTGRSELRQRVTDAAAARRAWTDATASSHPAGPGRLDMAGVAARGMGAAGGPPDAPVRIPPLWGVATYALAMRSGSVANAGAGPLLRNAAQVLASYGTARDVSVPDLLKIEALLRRLQPPPWPGDMFPPIDQASAVRGAAVFRQVCAGCHGARTADRDRLVPPVMVAIGQAGTDPAANGEQWRTVVAATEPVVPERMQSGLTRWRAASAEQVRRADAVRATPLAGIWAAAPFLHNGSVSNLVELLRPAAERTGRLTPGGRDYDPALVGYPADVATGGFALDTTLPGNAASGHEYGTRLSEDAKRDLIEYLKTL